MPILRTLFSKRLLMLLVIPVVSVIYPLELNADELDGRPWGRLAKPSFSAPETPQKNGYLGRYNPWVKSGDNATDEPPRYRKRGNDAPSYTLPGSHYSSSGPSYPPYVPPTQSYLPNNSIGAQSYLPRSYSSNPEFSPWNGYLNPNYGNYWNDPYDNLRPDRGILWSDMWR